MAWVGIKRWCSLRQRTPQLTGQKRNHETLNNSHDQSTRGQPARAEFEALGTFTTPLDSVERVFGDDRFGTAAEISMIVPGKAKDSDLLDGKDSSYFSPRGLWGIATGSEPEVPTGTTAWTDLPDATVDVTIPAGEAGVIMARFTAESACYGGTIGDFDWCRVRVLVDGTVAQPDDNDTPFAFDSTDDTSDGSGSWEGHAMDRSTAVLPAGTYTVQVQYSVTDADVVFWLDDWHLFVEALLS